MLNIRIDSLINKTINSDLKYISKCELIHILRAMDIIEPWEESDYIKRISNSHFK